MKLHEAVGSTQPQLRMKVIVWGSYDSNPPHTSPPTHTPPHWGNPERTHGVTPAGKQSHSVVNVDISLLGPHCSPAAQTPSVHCGVVPPAHGMRGSVVVVVVVLLVLLVVVVVVAQPACVQASQQLAKLPVHARPPFGAVHFVALLLIVHDVRP